MSTVHNIPPASRSSTGWGFSYGHDVQVADVCLQRSFMSAGSLTLGGNMSIAVGPLGRNGEALGSVNSSGKVAAMSVL